jgi:hypothetical protein
LGALQINRRLYPTLDETKGSGQEALFLFLDARKPAKSQKFPVIFPDSREWRRAREKPWGIQNRGAISGRTTSSASRTIISAPENGACGRIAPAMDATGVRPAIAFSSEVDTGSREENASKPEIELRF